MSISWCFECHLFLYMCPSGLQSPPRLAQSIPDSVPTLHFRYWLSTGLSHFYTINFFLNSPFLSDFLGVKFHLRRLYLTSWLWLLQPPGWLSLLQPMLSLFSCRTQGIATLCMYHSMLVSFSLFFLGKENFRNSRDRGEFWAEFWSEWCVYVFLPWILRKQRDTEAWNSPTCFRELASILVWAWGNWGESNEMRIEIMGMRQIMKG